MFYMIIYLNNDLWEKSLAFLIQGHITAYILRSHLSLMNFDGKSYFTGANYFTAKWRKYDSMQTIAMEQINISYMWES